MIDFIAIFLLGVVFTIGLINLLVLVWQIASRSMTTHTRLKPPQDIASYYTKDDLK